MLLCSVLVVPVLASCLELGVSVLVCLVLCGGLVSDLQRDRITC